MAIESRFIRRGFRLAAALLGALALALGCGREPAAKRPPPRQLVVLGIDGADWKVIRWLWSRGELPNLRRLASRGTRAALRTDYGESPVIWTTVATGRLPREHGINGFVAPTEVGDVPISSTMRRVPALWNMASAAGLSSAVVSWWGSWPAEKIRGVVVSDRTAHDLDGAVAPESFAFRFAAIRAAARARGDDFGSDAAVADRDRTTAAVARVMVAGGHDLVLAYVRGVDAMSHRYWRYAFPEGFPPLPPEEAAAHRDEIPRVYAAADRALGALVEAAPDANVVVLSDHGFHRRWPEQATVGLDFDLVLERLGYLVRRGEAIDWARTRVYTWSSQPHAQRKLLRFALGGREPGGTVRPADQAPLQAALARDLSRVTWEDGRPLFRLRAATPRQRKEGIDLVATVQQPVGAAGAARLDGVPWAEAIIDVLRTSGTHGTRTAGIFVAAGPDVLRGADVSGIHIHDMAPTFLYALGLPVGKDMAGRARVDLFTAEHRRRLPLRTIATWGAPRPGRALRSRADAELVEELQALGYLR